MEQARFQSIKDRMLKNFTSERDRREGSLPYCTLAPVARELEYLYFQLDSLKSDMFLRTMSTDALLKTGEMYGIYIINATQALLKAEMDADIPANLSFKCEENEQNYRVVRKLDEENRYEIQAEEFGAVGNISEGTLIPPNTIEGLTTARIVETIRPARDRETIEEYRRRVIDSFNTVSFAGNIADYKRLMKSLPGVRAVKVKRTPSGAGTVGVTILDGSLNVASPLFIEELQQRIDPVERTGEGEGMAPIGHRVTINTPGETEILISAKVSIKANKTLAELKESIDSALNYYIYSLREEWEDSNKLIVRYSKILSTILAVDGVEDVTDLSINNRTENIEIGIEQVPKLGETAWIE